MAVNVNVKFDEGALSAPGIFVNKFQATLQSGLVRIAFAEEVGGAPPTYRTAVVLTPSDAVELAQLLARMLAVPAEIIYPPTVTQSPSKDSADV